MAGDRVITMGTLGAKQEATNKDLADKIALRTGWVADGDATPTTGDLGTDGTDVDVVNPAVKLKFFGGGAKVYDLGNQTAGINIPGGGCVDHIDYFAALLESSAVNATITVGAGETLVVTGTFSFYGDGPFTGSLAIIADGTNYGSMYESWTITTTDATTFTVTNVFVGLSAGDHTIGFFVNGVAVSDGPWAFMILHCASACVHVHIATGG